MSGTRLEQEGYTLPVAAPPHNEGKTLAGWTMAAIITAGVLVSCFGLIFESPVFLWVVGPIVMVVGLIVGLILRLTGKGQAPDTPRPPREWYDSPVDRAGVVDASAEDLHRAEEVEQAVADEAAQDAAEESPR